MAALNTRKLDVEEERALAGRLAGVMFLTGGLTAVLLLFLPGIEDRHWEWVVALGGVCVAFGLFCLALSGPAAGKPWCRHIPAIATLGIIAGVMGATGGATSPARFYVFFLLVYVTHYFPRRQALLYLPACVAVALSPLLYDTAATSGGYLGELLVICPAYVIVGGSLMDGKGLLVDLRERAHMLAHIDPLTELPNRRAMLDWLGAQMEAGPGVGLMLVDLDGFKDVNTAHGYPAGDAVLRGTAAHLQHCVRTDDVVARLGGDEFAVLAPGATPETMRQLAERTVRSLRDLRHEDISLSASVGWVIYPDDAQSVDDLIAAADFCLRGAKLTGKDRALTTLDWAPDIAA